MNFLETFRLLLAAASPSGYEAPEAEVIRRLAAPYCDKIKTDPMGNLICRKKGSGKKLMLAAHMDVIGFMVSRFEKNGFLSVTNVGGHRPARLSGKKVRFPSGVRGLLFERAEAKFGEKKAGETKMTDILLDIGATSEEDGSGGRYRRLRLRSGGNCRRPADEPLLRQFGVLRGPALRYEPG